MTTTLILSGVIGFLLLANGFLLLSRRRLSTALNNSADAVLDMTEIINTGITPENLLILLTIRDLKKQVSSLTSDRETIKTLNKSIRDLEKRVVKDPIAPAGPEIIKLEKSSPLVDNSFNANASTHLTNSDTPSS